jgi:hypothetical protein
MSAITDIVPASRPCASEIDLARTTRGQLTSVVQLY